MLCTSRLIKRAAVVGRLDYHTAQCLLAQINPVSGRDTADMRTAQLHHAHQVCGIVAHTTDRGVASVSIRSLAIVAEVLADPREQREVVAILERIDRETGWKLAGVLAGLRRGWGWGDKRGRRGRRSVTAMETAEGNSTDKRLYIYYYIVIRLSEKELRLRCN